MKSSHGWICINRVTFILCSMQILHVHILLILYVSNSSKLNVMKNILHDKKYAKILKTSTWVGLLPESYIRFKTPSPHIMCC